jgi:hypothetical protein
MDGAASCSLRQLPLKRVDPFPLLLKGLAEDKANQNLAFNELPRLFEELPQQTIAAINMKSFDSFYEKLFKNRKSTDSKVNWENMFKALRVENSSHKGDYPLDYHIINIYNNIEDNFSGSKMLVILPDTINLDYRFFKLNWCKTKDSYYVEEYIHGNYYSRNNLEFSRQYYCSEAFDKFLREIFFSPTVLY